MTPTPEPARARAAQLGRRLLTLRAGPAYLVGLAVLFLLSPVLEGGRSSVTAYAIWGALFFGGRAWLREKGSYCRACHRWFVTSEVDSTVTKRKPFTRQHNTQENVTYHGRHVGTIERTYTTSHIRETVEIVRMCTACGDVQVVTTSREQ